MTHPEHATGHRARLRQRFLADPMATSEPERLELLLTYAIPRQDTAPLAQALLDCFGSIKGVFAASYEELTAVAGIGEQAATLIRLMGLFRGEEQSREENPAPVVAQPALLEVEPALGPLFEDPEPKAPRMRTFANDEIANSLTFIPHVAEFEDFDSFKAHLRDQLPYNSESTRQRRANYILDRFFPEGRLDVPLAYYVARCDSQEDLKPALFYHLLKSEPLAARVAEELIWPALPLGRVDREAMRESVLRHLPDAGPASQTKILRSLFNTYLILGVGTQNGTTLRFQVQSSTVEAFLYILTAEFPQPGMYSFDALESGPMRLWLLWDREWMRRQLYNLRDLGLIAKVSEIDTLRQFTLSFDQWPALRYYFRHPQRTTLPMREKPPA